MNNKILYWLSIILAFVIGCIVTYIVMTKKYMDNLLQAKGQSQPSATQILTNQTQPVDNTQFLIENEDTIMADIDNRTVANNATNRPLSINEYSQTQAQAIIEDMPDYVLGRYVDKFMAKDASNIISDKRRFAERAIEELYQPNDNTPLDGEIKLSFDASMPSQSIDVSTIDKFAKIYAHLDTGGRVANSPYVFIKWVNNQTGQVLLFEKKDIVADKDQNWVSFKPYDGWQVGSYDIRFYQFTSELQPIAQLTYNIYEVIE